MLPFNLSKYVVALLLIVAAVLGVAVILLNADNGRLGAENEKLAERAVTLNAALETSVANIDALKAQATDAELACKRQLRARADVAKLFEKSEIPPVARRPEKAVTSAAVKGDAQDTYEAINYEVITINQSADAVGAINSYWGGLLGEGDSTR